VKEYEVKVTYTAYLGVEAYNKEQAIEQAKEIVARNYNGTMSDDADYEITEGLCEWCDSDRDIDEGRLCEGCRRESKESERR